MFGGQQYDETLYWGPSFVFGGQQYDETLYWGPSFVFGGTVLDCILQRVNSML